MKLRITVLLLFVALVVGIPIYLLRHSHDQQVREWRQASRFFFRELGDLDRAQELNDKILSVFPKSAFDLLWKAFLLERKGSPEDLGAALEIHDSLIAAHGASALMLHLQKARIHRALGRPDLARATALSVVDVYPFEAFLEAGLASRQSFSPLESLMYFRRALEDFASTDIERAMAHEALAEVYELLANIQGGASAAREAGSEDAEARERAVGALRENARQELDRALATLRSIPEKLGAQDRIRHWLASMALKRSRLRLKGEAPALEAARLLESRIEADTTAGNEISPRLFMSVGKLYAGAAWNERKDGGGAPGETSAELLEKASSFFLQALGGRSLADARALLGATRLSDLEESEERPEGERLDSFYESRDYIQALVEVARVYLASPQWQRVLDDASPLGLSRRISDAAEVSEPAVASVFELIRALGLLRSGDLDGAEAGFERFLSKAPAAERPSATVSLAEQCLRLLPDDSLALTFLDRFEESEGGLFRLLGRRVRLLIAARQSAALEEEASLRLERVLRALAGVPKSPQECLEAVQILRGLGRIDEALATLRDGRRSFPDHPMIRQALAEQLAARAEALERAEGDEARDERAGCLAEALDLNLLFFLEQPAQGDAAFDRSRSLVGSLDEPRVESVLEDVVRRAFPRAGTAAPAFSSALLSFLRGDLPRALEQTESLPDPEPFQPFLSFLRGTCRLEGGRARSLAAAEADEPAAAEAERAAERSRLVALARAEFEKHPQFYPNRLELAQLELEGAGGGDVPDSLLDLLESLVQSDEESHQARWLLARALTLRLVHRRSQPGSSVEDLQDLLYRLQSQLRAVIRLQPGRVRAYQALADSIVLPPPGSAGGPGAPAGGARTGDQGRRYLRAVQILKAVPRPDEAVLTRLAAYLGSAGEAVQALRYQAFLAVWSPGPGALQDLVQSALAANQKEVLEEILADDPASAALAALDAREQRVLDQARGLLAAGATDASSQFYGLLRLAGEVGCFDRSRPLPASWRLLMRERLRRIPLFDGFRSMFLGQIRAEESRQALSSDAKESLVDRAIAEYERALDAFESQGVEVPVALLNNLAYQLIQDDDPGRIRRGLELAGKARERVRGKPGQAPFLDTYAWALFRSGRLKEAEQELREILKEEDAPVYRYHLAEILFRLGEYRDAEVEVRRAIDSGISFESIDAARDLQSRIREEFGKALQPEA
ncbi:MAG: hypothetical protein JXA90_01140 [Planctomycetes bacterium]|nr:hypothetical protein [Planctomycetota bacterium]